LKDFLDELEACESEFQYLSAQELSHLGLDKEAEKLYLKAFNLRPEQQQFRQALLKVYRRCAVTGCRIESVLDAAHIVPHSKTRNNDITNGLILRVDIHRLFDDCLIAIHPQTLQVHVSPELEETEYFGFQGCVITVPTNTEYQPDKIALKWQWNRCSWNISRD
jgi:predicted restriction endonuclease